MPPPRSPEALKKQFGEEYPQAIVLDGFRLPLTSEGRFSRRFYSQEKKTGAEISRFMDGTAAITAVELKREWLKWSQNTRLDFCIASKWLEEQTDFPDMLRYIIRNGGPQDWSAMALSIASQLPSEEAFRVLVEALDKTEPGQGSNIGQAIAKTKHVDAEDTLRKQLASLWTHPKLWDDDDFLNWIAFDATTCIGHLIELGAPPSDFEAQVRKLSEHACSGNHRSCCTFLSKHYSWLKKPSTEEA
jgi:hypothetical protein